MQITSINIILILNYIISIVCSNSFTKIYALRMPGRKSSDVWKDFTKLINHEAHLVQCKICRIKIKHCNNTSNMKAHLVKIHNKSEKKTEANQSVQNTSDPEPSAPSSNIDPTSNFTDTPSTSNAVESGMTSNSAKVRTIFNLDISLVLVD